MDELQLINMALSSRREMLLRADARWPAGLDSHYWNSLHPLVLFTSFSCHNCTVFSLWTEGRYAAIAQHLRRFCRHQATFWELIDFSRVTLKLNLTWKTPLWRILHIRLRWKREGSHFMLLDLLSGLFSLGGEPKADCHKVNTSASLTHSWPPILGYTRYWSYGKLSQHGPALLEPDRPKLCCLDILPYNAFLQE